MKPYEILIGVGVGLFIASLATAFVDSFVDQGNIIEKLLVDRTTQIMGLGLLNFRLLHYLSIGLALSSVGGFLVLRKRIEKLEYFNSIGFNVRNVDSPSEEVHDEISTKQEGANKEEELESSGIVTKPTNTNETSYDETGSKDKAGEPKEDGTAAETLIDEASLLIDKEEQ